MDSKLKELRTQKKYTSRVMANKLDISLPYYSQIENKQRRLSYEMAIKIAHIFKTKPDKIFYNEYSEDKK
jgi:Predicted transcriptional regulators